MRCAARRVSYYEDLSARQMDGTEMEPTRIRNLVHLETQRSRDHQIMDNFSFLVEKHFPEFSLQPQEFPQA